MGTGIFASTARFYIHDHLYSPVALTDYSGSVLERCEYDAYGNPTIWNADFTTERDSSNYGNPYLFTGRRTGRKIRTNKNKSQRRRTQRLVSVAFYTIPTLQN